ncbi:MAG TPA: sulfotransferase [Victivallales bacterium]|nr:sulfotransferase [Victivallales bacterium]
MLYDNKIRLVGAALPRTGTVSIKTALKIIGFGNCYKMEELFQKPKDLPYWLSVFEGNDIPFSQLLNNYDAILDLPGCLVIDKLINYYPNAKVILTIRNPEEWYNSIINTIYPTVYMPVHNNIPIFEFIRKYFFDEFLKNSIKDKDKVIKVCEDYYNKVRDIVPRKNLLEYNVTEGWKPLCEFLGYDIPQEVFPYKNTKKDFNRQTGNHKTFNQ